MKNTFGFIGAGNMGGALAAAVCKSCAAENVVLADHDTEKAKKLAIELGSEAADNAKIAAECKYIFLGVKPQVMAEMLCGISGVLKSRTDRFIIVTMAAGLSADKICEMAGGSYPIIRIMPNTPAFVGEGMILYSTANGVTDSEEQEFTAALSAAGQLDKIDERLIDAAGSLSGCGPAFVYLFAEALADGAVECGLPRDKALLYAAQTIIGAGKMLIETGSHPGELKDAVCSPGGTTIAGVHALEDGAFRSLCMDAVRAAYKRTLELK